ncbi:MAG: Na+/H+ antiporter NhaC family protein [Candidatus Babeliales bacterium]
MKHSWVTLLPPTIVLVCSSLTKRVSFSLLMGITSAALIVSHFYVPGTVAIATARIFNEIIDPANMLTNAFLLLLGMIITLMNLTGGTYAYGVLLQKWLKTARHAKLSSIALSLCFMIDDFFSSLTVGCIMKPLFDTFHIPRVKLAYLIDSLAAPMVIIMPFSTWLAMILMQLHKAGIHEEMAQHPLIIADPFLTYLRVIPFILYSFACLATVFFISYFSISYGPMAAQEAIAHETGNLFGGKSPLKETVSIVTPTGSIIDFAFPLISLITCCVATILHDGNSTVFGGTNGVLAAVQQANIFWALFFGAAISFVISFCFMIFRKKMGVFALVETVRGGFDLMWTSIVTLVLAWTFSSMLRTDLFVGSYLAQSLTGTIAGWLLPALFYCASLITAIATGSSWGTIAVMVPIAVPMLPPFFGIATPATPETIAMVYPVIGAIFSGAVAGDHVSPIAPTSIMSATSAGCYLTDHIVTQLPYAIPALVNTVIGYLAIGLMLHNSYSLWQSWAGGMATALIGTILCISIANRLAKERA